MIDTLTLALNETTTPELIDLDPEQFRRMPISPAPSP
jgi:hypothetical protein